MFTIKNDTLEYSIRLQEIYKAKSSYSKPYCKMHINSSEYGSNCILLSKDDLENWIVLSERTLNGDVPTGTIQSNDNNQSKVEVRSSGNGIFYWIVKETYGSYVDIIAVFEMEQLRQLREALPKEIEAFFTENHGKIAYYTYKKDVSKSNFEWIYRASKLQEILNRYMVNDHIEYIFVDLCNYVDSSGAPGILDYDGGIIFVLSRFVIDLSILCDGVFGISIIDRSKIVFDRIFDFVPDDAHFSRNDEYVFDLLDIADVSLRNVSIKSCEVTAQTTNLIPFTPDNYDDEKAMLYNEVPSRIHINFRCDHYIEVYGSDTEYFGVILN